MVDDKPEALRSAEEGGCTKKPGSEPSCAGRWDIKACFKYSLVFLCCCLVVGSFWRRLDRVLPHPSVSGWIDLRSDRTRHDYSIMINVVEAGFYGHARLTWIKHTATERKTRSYGYYAKNLTSITEIFDTEGILRDETDSPDSSNGQTRYALVFWVEEGQFDETLSRIQKWKPDGGRYNIFKRDCVSFVADMLSPLHLKAPSRALLPRPFDYIVALIEKNAKREES